LFKATPHQSPRLALQVTPMSSTTSPFGTYALSPWREAVRRLAASTPSGKPGMWMISVLRKIALSWHVNGMSGPLDVEVADGIRARLFPKSNRCEKRAFAGVHIWDTNERALLDRRISQHDNSSPFVFFDVGANVGLYSLFVNASCKQHGVETQIVAVEPDEENRSRLQFNMEASDCSATIEPIGISDEAGTGVLTEAGPNRGGISIKDQGEGVSIKLETLAQLIKRHKLTRVDAMKLDIEGRDDAALRSMAATLEPALWPQLLIVETGRHENSPIVNHMVEQGYRVIDRTGINAILEFKQTEKPSAGTARKQADSHAKELGHE